MGYMEISKCNAPKAIFYLLAGDYQEMKDRVIGTRLIGVQQGLL